ncbi:MAG: hypothetical protein H6747_16540 [Deltaproteobacteria bacterium]|nr:hypothetical protein [Deltaproteobacteria bacterium]
MRQRPLLPVLTAISLGLAACSPPAQGSGSAADASDDTFGFVDTGAGGLGDTGADTAASSDSNADDGAPSDTLDDTGGGDAGDGAGADDGTGPDAADSGDSADDATTADSATGDGGSTDAGPSPTSACVTYVCNATTFTFAPPGGAVTVKLAGSMNAWKVDKAPELLDPDGDGTFELVTTLSPGTYSYKFVADDKWYQDPTNPDGVDDGYGGQNSVIVVPSCNGPLKLEGHATDEDKGSFDATFSVQQGPIALSDLAVTVDWKPAPAGALSWKEQGKTLGLQLTGLPAGVHDVRVGCGVHEQLLKVAVKAPSDWRDTVLYFAMTDRFVNGDSNNDAPFADVPASTNWAGGDFAGLKQKVEDGYFSDLGVGAIWISWPVVQPAKAEPGGRPDASGCNLDPKKIPYVPIAYSGYHGYWPVEPDAVEPRFGTLEELRAFVTAAHAKGIRVLLDFTANHVHTDSPWFKNHQEDGWFHLPAEVCADVGWETKPVECWFTNYLADFDHDGPARYALLDSALGWAKKTGVDGFRVDAVKHVEMGFVEDLRRRVQDELELTGFPFWLVGETFTGDAGAIKAFVSPTRLHGQFDFSGNYAMLETFAKQWKGLDGLDAAWRGAFGVYGGDALMSTFLGNHDIARFLSVAAGTLTCGIWDMVSDQAAGWKSPPAAVESSEPYERLQLGFAWLFAVPGIPLLYHGDEFGMPGAGDPDNRRMMRFGSQLTANEATTLAYVQQLGKARAAHPALRKGSWAEPLWKEADFIAFARTLGDDRVVVLVHRGGAEKSGTLDVSSVGWADGTALVDALSGVDVGSVTGGKLAFTVPPRTARYLVAK